MTAPLRRRAGLALLAATLVALAACGGATYMSVGVSAGYPAPWGGVTVGTTIPLSGYPPGGYYGPGYYR